MRWSFIALIIAAVSGLFVVGVYRLKFETDILASLPQADPVLSDARSVIMHHPAQDRIIIDVSLQEDDSNRLIEAAGQIEARLRASGLFKEVGLGPMQQLMPELMIHVVKHLSMLFSEKELEETIRPLLAKEKIRQALADNLLQLGGLEGIGQADLLSRDPLGLRNVVLSRLSGLIPAKDAQFYKGQLISSDRRHLLVVTVPATSGMDTEFAGKVTALIEDIAIELNKQHGREHTFTLTPVGAYRAALDNELNAKENVRRAVLFSTVAVALLLLAAFPRPLIGLLALVPACAGTMLAFFVYSLFHTSISLLAVGFGGAIVSFTVDYGIAYLLFLDRPYETRGLEASKEVWSLGLLAMLTTAVSFFALSLSGFPALSEIGQFAGLGVIFTYIFVHAIFPLIFQTMPAAKRTPLLPLQNMVNWLASSRGTGKAFAAMAFCAGMLFFAKPEFHIKLDDLNAVGRETLEAEKLIKDVWGDISGSIYLMIEGQTKEELLQRGDRLAAMLLKEVASNTLLPSFAPPMIFPADELAHQNSTAWQRFWNADQTAELEKTVQEASLDLGFSSEAFAPFFTMIRNPDSSPAAIPEQFYSFLGIATEKDQSVWRQVLTLTPGPSYHGEAFYRRCASTGFVRIFDPALFSEKFGAMLLSAFIKMAVIVGVVTVLVVFFYFMDWQLTLLGIAPTIFSLICTFGTLKLMGQPLSIPILMVTVVVIGMGTDYALYLIRSYQRYLDEDNPSVGLIRMSVFLSFATTFLGFGVLALCDNAMLKSAGLGLSLGIGYSFLGAVTIVPPFLKSMFIPVQPTGEAVIPGSKRHLKLALTRYRHIEAYPRLFARFKILLDPMFPRLADFLSNPHTIIDIGSGYGVPAAWLLELYPDAKVYGIEPDRKRARFATRAIGSRGSIEIGQAPAIPDFSGMADAALMLDMIHYLSDEELYLTLQRVRAKLHAEGLLIMRATIPVQKQAPMQRWLETTKLKLCRIKAYFRSEQAIRSMLAAAGFKITCVEPTELNREETWFIAQ